MRRSKTWFIKIFLITFVPISALLMSLQVAAADYPANPGIDDTSIYLSDAGISKINIETLEIEWNVLTHKQTFEPVVTDRHIVVGSSTGMYVLDKLSGSIIWNIQTEYTLFSPVVENNTAFVGSKEGLFQAIDLQTGQVLWASKFEGWVYPPALVGEILIVGGNRPYLTALHKTTGKVLWKRKISQELVYRPVSIDRNRVVISTFGNETQLINSNNGNVIWTFRNEVPSFSPVLLKDEIIFGTLDGRLQSVNISNGNLLWERKLGGYLSIKAYPKRRIVVISNNQGKIIKIDANDGLIKWEKQLNNDLVGVPVLLNDNVVVFPATKFNAPSSIEVFDTSQQAGGYDES